MNIEVMAHSTQIKFLMPQDIKFVDYMISKIIEKLEQIRKCINHMIEIYDKYKKSRKDKKSDGYKNIQKYEYEIYNHLQYIAYIVSLINYHMNNQSKKRKIIGNGAGFLYKTPADRTIYQARKTLFDKFARFEGEIENLTKDKYTHKEKIVIAYFFVTLKTSNILNIYLRDMIIVPFSHFLKVFYEKLQKYEMLPPGQLDRITIKFIESHTLIHKYTTAHIHKIIHR